MGASKHEGFCWKFLLPEDKVNPKESKAKKENETKPESWGSLMDIAKPLSQLYSCTLY